MFSLFVLTMTLMNSPSKASGIETVKNGTIVEQSISVDIINVASYDYVDHCLSYITPETNGNDPSVKYTFSPICLNPLPITLQVNSYYDNYFRYWDKNFAYDNYVKIKKSKVLYKPKLC